MAMKIQREEVIQPLLDLFEQPHYLEIGVFEGKTFHALHAERRVGVDPEFPFSLGQARREHPNAEYHMATSDEYFGRIVAPGERFDVVFLDGLHQFEQTLRDLLNALCFVRPDGIIVIDDVKPFDYLAAIEGREKWMEVRRKIAPDKPLWMGDVYRLVFFIESFLQQYRFMTVAETHGQAVLWRRARPEVPDKRMRELAALDYGDLVLEMDHLRVRPLGEILECICRDRRAMGFSTRT